MTIERALRSRLGAATIRAAAALAAVTAASQPARAHPHVFVGVETTVLYKDAKVIGLAHTWTFDDLYSADAVQGLDKNGDGAYSREELAELTSVNMNGLKEVNYFTTVKLGEAPVKLAPPADPWLEFKDGILSLHFTLPLEEPVLAEAQGLGFAVYDESFYIALEYASAAAIKLSDGAPSGCVAALQEPQPDSDAQKLSDAFSTALAVASYGGSMAKTVSISCAKT